MMIFRMRLLLLILVVVALSFGSSACRKSQNIVTPEQTASTPSETEPGEPIQSAEDPSAVNLVSELAPIFFDYDRSDIRSDQASILQKNAEVLRKSSNHQVLLEGHCDERGTDEYNLALGDRRARAAKEYLVTLGVPESRIKTISFGESRPYEIGHDESAWQQNRRAQPVLTTVAENK